MMTLHRVHVYGDDVNTDVIFPGKYTYTLRLPEEIAAHALEDLDADFVRRVGPGDVIVAGRNWGIGSSREQAVTCLKSCGITHILAASFGGLYFRNCINQGVYPAVCPGLAQAVQTGDFIAIDAAAGTVTAGGRVFVLPPLSSSARAILQAGGLLPMLRVRFGMPGEVPVEE